MWLNPVPFGTELGTKDVPINIMIMKYKRIRLNILTRESVKSLIICILFITLVASLLKNYDLQKQIAQFRSFGESGFSINHIIALYLRKDQIESAKKKCDDGVRELSLKIVRGRMKSPSFYNQLAIIIDPKNKHEDYGFSKDELEEIKFYIDSESHK